MPSRESFAGANDQTSAESPRGATPERKRRRPRVSEACGACRDRKTRCDGRRPICRACESRGNEANCKFTGNQRRPRPSQRPPTAPQAISPASGLRRRLSCTPPGSPRGPPTDATRTSGGVTSSSGQPWFSTQSDGLATFAGRDDELIYGPSSTVAFLRHVLTNDDARTQGTAAPAPAAPGLPPIRAPERMPDRNAGIAVLPRRRTADDFLSCFWEFVHPMFPVLHKPTFLRQYERFWTAESEGGQLHSSPDTDADDIIFLSSMNLVFAMGCRFSDLIADAQKASVADEFYQRSRQLFVFDILDSATLPLVQMLVLTGVYLQSTQHASRCWNSIGLAIRVAQGLGLHVDPTARKTTSQIECETRRRIWYTCVNLDRLLAMTFGRPTMIRTANTVSVPALIDDEYLSEKGGIQPADQPSQLGLFVSSCTLLELLEEVLTFLSKTEPAPTLKSQGKVADQQAKLVMQVLDLNRRLDDFSATVPAYLRTSGQAFPHTKLENQIHLQQQVLLCRFLLTRLLLLRPLLLLSTASKSVETSVQTLDGAGQAPLDQQTIRQCCELCVQTAYRLVDAIHANLGTLYRSTGWHAVYFIFSAAIVLLASLKCDMLNMRADDDAFETTWNRCLSILQHYKDQVHSASHAIQSLTAVRQQILQKSNNTEQPPNDANDAGFIPSMRAMTTPHQQPAYWDVPATNNLFSIDHIPEEYFGPHLTNLDWLELFQTHPGS